MEMFTEKRIEDCLDFVLHLNGLLPCVLVYWALAVMESAWLAVFLYESICLIGLPFLTMRLRSVSTRKKIVSRVRPLLLSVFRPSESPSCLLVTTGSLCVFGFGGFFVFLGFAQTQFEHRGISQAIATRSAETGIRAGSIARDIALIFLAVWFCTVNPFLEEMFWRGYLYNELGRQLSCPHIFLEERSIAPRALLRADQQTIFSRWLLSFYFASFHGVVVWIFVNIYIAIVTIAFLALVSRLWIFLAERPPFGFPFIVAFHAGADLAVVLVVSACDFNWAEPRVAYIAAILVSFFFALIGFFLLYLAWRDHTNPTCLLQQRGRWHRPTNRSGGNNSLLAEAAHHHPVPPFSAGPSYSPLLSSLPISSEEPSSSTIGDPPQGVSSSSSFNDATTSNTIISDGGRHSTSTKEKTMLLTSISEERGAEMI
mmetsp:Transcript_14366/g.21696  ORF Transcript_14366/g.21696 Transcript_14366/m.21696 type:complete len:427 (+) Transcript_14366:55-1335(+)